MQREAPVDVVTSGRDGTTNLLGFGGYDYKFDNIVALCGHYTLCSESSKMVGENADDDRAGFRGPHC